uniref:Uncharacterized protein n=1 Tax=Setaria digitata TaxID=48799 RepID=A0A915PY26_9BILA
MWKLDDVDHSANANERESNKHHHAMIDRMLRNREAELQKYADLQRKLHAAEKIEICRRIRSGAASPSDWHRAKPSRSLSRGRYMKRSRRRRSSASTDEKDLVQKIEAENEEPMYENPSLVYNRLSTNILKYRYLHKLDDETLALYMEQLRRQLSRLERFRQVSFGPFSVARHQSDPQVSWFFRRRSLPSLTDTTPSITNTNSNSNTNTNITQSNLYEQPTLRSIQSLKQHRSRSSKPQLTRNTLSGNDSRQRQRSTESSAARLPPTARNIRSGPTLSNNNANVAKSPRARKLTPTKPKKVVEKATTAPVPVTRRALAVAQKMKTKTDSEVSDIPVSVSPSPKLATKEVAEHRMESLATSEDEREVCVFSGVTSPENMDSRSGNETSEKSASPLQYSEMPIDDENDFDERSSSTVSDRIFDESKMEEVEVGKRRKTDVPLDSSFEMSEKTELEAISKLDSSEVSNISQQLVPEMTETTVCSKTETTDWAVNDNPMQESEKVNAIDELEENGMKDEKKSEGLLADGEHLAMKKAITEISEEPDHHADLTEALTEVAEEKPVNDKMIEEDKVEKTDETIQSTVTSASKMEIEEAIILDSNLTEGNVSNIPAKRTETLTSGDNTFSSTDEGNLNDISNKTESTLISGNDSKSVLEEKSEAHDFVHSVADEEVCSTKESVAETVKESNLTNENLISAGKTPSSEELDKTISYKEIEFSNDQQEIAEAGTEAKEVKLGSDETVEEWTTGSLANLQQSAPMLVSRTFATEGECMELPKSEIFQTSEQMTEASNDNEQRMCISKYMSESNEPKLSVKKKLEVESVKDAFLLENHSNNEELKHREETFEVKISSVPEENHPMNGDLDVDLKFSDKEKPKSSAPFRKGN